MARISNTKGIENVGGSMYELIMMAAHRGRSYDAANPPLIEKSHKRGMTALREIEKNVIDIDANRESMVNRHRSVFPKEDELLSDS